MRRENEYIIVQAGGKGTRLGDFTKNRAKCLVNIDGKPMLSLLAETFKEYNIIVIGDYKIDNLRKYIAKFHPGIMLVEAEGKGTNSGVVQALEHVPDDSRVTIIWSDLIFQSGIPDIATTGNTIGLSRTFDCRYQYESNTIVKRTGNTNGIAGFFSFSNKSELTSIPDSGSLVSGWMVDKGIRFDNIIWLDNVVEIGTVTALREYEQPKQHCRFFNSVKRVGNKIIKKAVVDKYNTLLDREYKWYTDVNKISGVNVPTSEFIQKENTLILDFIDGKHPYDLDYQTQREVLVKIGESFDKLHSSSYRPGIRNDIQSMYFDKLSTRVRPYSSIIHQYEKEYININGSMYKNPFYKDELDNFYKKLYSLDTKKFTPIHGDPTFSNMLWDGRDIWFIDPRGAFGSEEYSLYGDPAYDWAKLYYSAIDNYDNINLRDFDITILENETLIEFNNINQDIFWEICPIAREKIQLILCSIWFSLVGYVIEDTDAMNFAFAKGVITYNDRNSL